MQAKTVKVDIIGAIASINALIIAFLIANKKNKTTSDYILIAWVINFALHFATPFFIERHVFFHESTWGFIMAVFVVAHAPFIFVYANSLTNPKFKVNFKNLYHFGAILIFIAGFIPYFTLNQEERLNLALQKEGLSFYMFLPLILLLFIRLYFFIRTIIVVINFQYRIKQSFSYEKEINLAWLRRIVIGFFVIILLSFILYALASAKIIAIYVLDYVAIVANMILFFFIAYSGYKQNAIQEVISGTDQTESKLKTEVKTKPVQEIAKSGSTDNHDPVIIELQQLMDREKLYLEPELNIGNIANQLNVHAHQLSKLINCQLEKNFFEFVNEYRVEEFKKLATNPKNKHISILGLAMEAGFNSKSTFNRFFKNSTGLTPTEFMESYKF